MNGKEVQESVSCGQKKSKIAVEDLPHGDRNRDSDGDRDEGKGGKRKDEVKRRGLVSFWELPEYMKDNEYILNYYRANWLLTDALFSVFRWHNETLNVWTHLIGFILFLGLTITSFIPVPEAEILSLIPGSFPNSADRNISRSSRHFSVDATKLTADVKAITAAPPPQVAVAAAATSPVTRWPFLVFLGGAMFCLLSSSICHLFSCHSKNLNLILLRIDYTGITVMIVCSFFPPIFYIFQCTPLWYFVYLGTITAIGLFTVVTLLTPSLSSAKYRGFRAMLFSSMGLFGVVPAVHALVVNWNNPQRNVTLAYESAMALFYLTGTGFYVSRVPERWRPGWFDLAGHSHQIFHVFVVLGALAHYAATLLFLEWRHQFGCGNY